MNPFLEYKEILEKYLSPYNIFKLEEAWNEIRRKYHNMDHLIQILEDLEKKKKFVLPHHWEALVLAAFFHDAVYIPGRTDNEDKSRDAFFKCFKGKDLGLAKKVGQMIDVTKGRKRPTDPLLRLFWDADNGMFFKGDIKALIENEKKIRVEFGFASNAEYKKGRIKFLHSCLGTMGPKADRAIEELSKYVENNY